MGFRDWFKRKGAIVDAKGLAVGGASSLFTGRLVVGDNGHSVVPEDNSAVVASLRWAMRNYPKAPHIVQRLSGAQYETIATHPALSLLRKPNPYMSGRSMGQAVALSLMLDGNAYLFKARNGNGRLAELQYLMHGAVRVVSEGDKPIARYEYRVGGTTYKLDPADVIHIRDGSDPRNPLLGWSGLKSIVNEILTDNEASAYSYAVLRNLGVTGLMIVPTGDNVITEDQAELLKKKVKQQTTGDHRGEPIVAGQAIDIKANPFSPEQMALDKMRCIPESRICAVIGIPGIVLNLYSGEDTKTYSNYEEARAMALEDWLLPLYALIDDTLTNELLPEFGTGADERIARDLTHISALQEDRNALAQRLGYLYQTGVMMRSECRQLIDLPTTPADDVYWVDAQAAGLNTDVAKSLVKADVMAKSRARQLREAA